MALGTEQAPFQVSTVVADEPVRVEVTFQPDRTHAVIEELGDRDIKPGAVISLPAR
jgi:hypothetical protein